MGATLRTAAVVIGLFMIAGAINGASGWSAVTMGFLALVCLVMSAAFDHWEHDSPRQQSAAETVAQPPTESEYWQQP